MGIYDRDYYRDEQPEPGVQLGQRTVVTNLVIVNVAAFLLNMFLVFDQGAPNWLTEHLSLTPDVLGKPWLWWRLISYGFAHAPDNVGHVFWNMLGLWMFGREVESICGRREFLRFYLAALLAGGLVWCAMAHVSGQGSLLLGASGAVTAVTLLFVLYFPRRTILLMMVLPVPAWVVGVLIVVGNLLYVDKETVHHVAYSVHLVGAAFAICYYRFNWNLGRWLPDWPSARQPAARERPHLKVHDPDEDYEELDEEADRILEKVGREGLEQLSTRERRVLEDYSRRMRHKHR